MSSHGPGSSDGIATGYGLEGPWIESLRFRTSREKVVSLPGVL